MGKELDINEILKALREQVGSMAVEIAMLKATIAAMDKENADGIDN